MPIEVIAALIALAGVFTSAVVSYLVGARQAGIEVQKLRTEILQEFSTKLFEKRLEVYPELYAHLSNFIKLIQFGNISSAAINEFFSQVQEWDTKHSILFGGRTGLISYEFRLMFAELAKKSDKQLEREFGTPESLNELRRKVQRLELALKSELGIYAFESPTDIGEFKEFGTYQEVTESITKRTGETL